MGMYDSILFNNSKGETIDIQFKCGLCECLEYNIGDKIALDDGIYFGNEGSFVVFKGEIVAAFERDKEFLRTKWGGAIPFPTMHLDDANPLNPKNWE